MRKVAAARAVNDWISLIALMDVPLLGGYSRIVYIVFIAFLVAPILQEFSSLVIGCWHVVQLLLKEVLGLLLRHSFLLPVRQSSKRLLLMRKVLALTFVVLYPITSKNSLGLRRWTKLANRNPLLPFPCVIRIAHTLLRRILIPPFKVSRAHYLMIRICCFNQPSMSFPIIHNLNILIFGAKRFIDHLLLSRCHHHPLVIEILYFVLHAMLILWQLCHIMCIIVLFLCKIECLSGSVGALWTWFCWA